MTMKKITEVFKEVMYLDESDTIDADKSLFLDYDMTSIDFIDFSFELKKEFSLSADTDDIWPIDKMITVQELYSAKDKRWTEEGLKQLNLVLAYSGKQAITDPSIELRSLYAFFTLRYLSEKLRELQ